MSLGDEVYSEKDLSPVAAGFAHRLVAFLIDGSFLTACWVISWTMIGCLLFRLDHFSPDVFALVSSLMILCAPFGALFYFLSFHICGGQTPGKMLVGIKVVAYPQGDVSPGHAFLRWVGYGLSAAPCAAGFLWMLLNKDHRTWHDMLAGTMVVFASPEANEPSIEIS